MCLGVKSNSEIISDGHTSSSRTIETPGSQRAGWHIRCSISRSGARYSITGGGWAYYFVAKHYADNNPDLKAAFGYNKVELWNHCVRYGIKHYERQYERAR